MITIDKLAARVTHLEHQMERLLLGFKAAIDYVAARQLAHKKDEQRADNERPAITQNQATRKEN